MYVGEIILILGFTDHNEVITLIRLCSKTKMPSKFLILTETNLVSIYSKFFQRLSNLFKNEI